MTSVFFVLGLMFPNARFEIVNVTWEPYFHLEVLFLHLRWICYFKPKWWIYQNTDIVLYKLITIRLRIHSILYWYVRKELLKKINNLWSWDEWLFSQDWIYGKYVRENGDKFLIRLIWLHLNVLLGNRKFTYASHPLKQ